MRGGSNLWGTFALAVGLATGVAAQTFEASVIGILAGDTIEVMHGRKPAQITLYGVDAPELRQPYGDKALEILSNLTFNREVKVQVKNKDSAGRLVALVFLKGECLNEKLLAQGTVWWHRTSAPNESKYQKLETDARTARKGLWGLPNPIAPWDWREGQRD